MPGLRTSRFFLVLMLCSCLTFEGYSQLNRKAIKKNNRRIGSYKGKKSHFGTDKIYNAVGFSLNALNYYGDLAPKPNRFSTDIAFTRPAIGISFSHRFGPRYTVTGAFAYGTLVGADAESADRGDSSNGLYRSNRNLSFRNRVKELSIVATLDLFENESTYISRVKWTPYIYAGVSVFHHNPQGQVPANHVDNATGFSNEGEWVDLQPLGTEGQYSSLRETDVNYGIKPYKLIQPAIPMGIGTRFRINEVMDLSAEIGFRYLFTDYIDDVSQNYVDLGVFGDNELAKAMSYRSSEIPENQPFLQPNQSTVDGKVYNLLPGYGSEHPDNLRGNKQDRDIFMVTTFRLTYIIGKTFHRAKFR
jgi:hypothetical protein